MEVIFKDDDAMEEIVSVLEASGALAEHDNKVRAEVIYEIKKNLPQTFCNNCNQIACDGGRVGSIQECASVRLLIDTLFEFENELKEQNK